MPRRSLQLISLTAVLVVSSTANAQLSPDDVAGLQARGKVEGRTFTVAESNDARRPPHELPGVVASPEWRSKAVLDDRLATSLTFVAANSPLNSCYEAGEEVEVDVFVGPTGSVINGAQMTVLWDPACLEFASMTPGGNEAECPEGSCTGGVCNGGANHGRPCNPYTFEVYESLDIEGPGSICYAVGVHPFGGLGVHGNAVLAHITFTKIGVCNQCVLSFGGAQPPCRTYLTDNLGQPVEVIPEDSEPIRDRDGVWLVVPGDIVRNMDCNRLTTFVTWDPPTAGSDCAGETLLCTGEYPDDSPVPYGQIMSGGEFPVGVSEMCCTVTSNLCADQIENCWTVTVLNQMTLSVEVQLSPPTVGTTFERCICFDLYTSPAECPTHLCAVLTFGGDESPGVAAAELNVSPGTYCATEAVDPLHTLRSVDGLDCTDGAYRATFSGDPSSGGNWLPSGDLNGDGTIDPQDAAVYLAEEGTIYGTGDTTCATQAPHADLNADGQVDSTDEDLILGNSGRMDALVYPGTFQDSDRDRMWDPCDNCPDTWNPEQQDSDGDGLGDACEDACMLSEPPLADPTVPDGGSGTRVRHLGFCANPTGADREQAIRVRFTDLPVPFKYAEDRLMWVGEPVDAAETGAMDGCTPGNLCYKLSDLQCDPFYADWTTYGVVYVRSESLVPRGVYDLQAIDHENCSPANEADYSDPLPVTLSKWGDIVGGSSAASPQGTVDFDDISSAVDKFNNLPGAPTMSRGDLAPNLPDKVVDFLDIPNIVDAFRGLAYPYAGPPVVDPCQ